jgi:D-alanine-D-alanine ligase
MRVLVLHSDVAPDAPLDEQDTLDAAEAVSAALKMRGHEAPCVPFKPDLKSLKRMLDRERPDVVFNLVESVFGAGLYSSLACAMLGGLNVPFTGGSGANFMATSDKPFAKGVLRAAGLATPDWAMPEDWARLDAERTYIVKAMYEDASLGLEEDSIVPGRDVAACAVRCQKRHGGRWFAEDYVEGREFNIALIAAENGPRVLPMAEMMFENWPAGRRKIVGWTAKWGEGAHEYTNTNRRFAVEAEEPALARDLAAAAKKAWNVFSLTGYARVDFRVTNKGELFILEINPNPGIAPDGGFAAAGAEAGWPYDEVIMRIVEAARR